MYPHMIGMSAAKEVKCEICGTTFITQQDKAEHKKLEHKEHRGTIWCWLDR